MKPLIITPLLFLLLASGFSQDLNYEIRAKYEHAIKKETVEQAQAMNDLIPYYPTNWIASYTSTEIRATNNGKEVIAMGLNNVLSDEQKQILCAADPGTDVIINIDFKYNSSTTDLVQGKMHYTATLVPEIQAEFPGGDVQLKQYLMDKAINRLKNTSSKELGQALLGFTVNEDGEITNARVSNTSGDPETDKLLLETINNMPRWIPAEDSKGVKVKQQFVFSVGLGGC